MVSVSVVKDVGGSSHCFIWDPFPASACRDWRKQ